VFSRLWEAYGHGRLDDALHLIDPDCKLHVSVSHRHVTAFDHSGRRVYDAPLAAAAEPGAEAD
jgi:hypothetical protein